MHEGANHVQKGRSMRKGKGIAFALVGVLILGLSLLAAACGSGSTSSTGSSSPSATPTSALSIATKVLGHAPTGLAKTIIDRGSLVVCDDANYPPQSSIDKSGNLVGFDVDVAKMTAQILGLKPDIQTADWTSIPTSLQADRYDVSIGSMTITKQREQQLSFTDPYYYTTGQVMVKVGTPLLTSAASLKGKTIGCGAQTTYYYWMTALGGVKIKAYATDADAFPDLANGRLNGVMSAGATEMAAIASGQPFQLSGKPMYYERLAFATRQAEPDFIALLNYAIAQMHKNGTLAQLSAKWYNGQDYTVPPTGVPLLNE